MLFVMQVDFNMIHFFEKCRTQTERMCCRNAMAAVISGLGIPEPLMSLVRSVDLTENAAWPPKHRGVDKQLDNVPG